MKKTFDINEVNLTNDVEIVNNKIVARSEYAFLLLDYENKEKDLKNNYTTQIVNSVNFSESDDCAVFNGGWILIKDFEVKSNESFTIGLWVYIPEDSSGGYYFIFRQKDTDEQKYHSLLRYNDGTFRYAFKNNISPSEGFDFYFDGADLNIWLYVKIVYDGSNTLNGFKCYVNGVEKTKTNIQLNNPFSENITILGDLALGNNPDYNIPFTGKMKNYRYWRYFQVNTDIYSLGKDYENNIYKEGDFQITTNTFFDAYNNEITDLELNGNVNDFRLIDENNEYYYDGENWRTPLDDSEWNDFQIISSHINDFTHEPMGFKFILSSDGNNSEYFKSIIMSYSLLSDNSVITFDKEKRQQYYFYKGEKKLISIKFYTEDNKEMNLNEETDEITVNIYYSGTIDIYDTITNIEFSNDNQNEILFYLDLTKDTCEYGAYDIEVKIKRGDTFIDIDKSLKFLVK